MIESLVNNMGKILKTLRERALWVGLGRQGVYVYVCVLGGGGGVIERVEREKKDNQLTIK